MAHHTEQAGFPALPLAPGMVVKLEARSPTTDAEVAGVTSSNWSIYGDDDAGGPPLTLEVPRWSPTELKGLV